eukprot:gene14519-30909_t
MSKFPLATMHQELKFVFLVSSLDKFLKEMLADLFKMASANQTTANTKYLRNQREKSEMTTKPIEKRSSFGFVGLENQGATCYLNSLIQAMYMTPELRRGLYHIDPNEIGVRELEQEKIEKEIEPAKVTAVIEPNEHMLEQLISMGFPEHGVKKALIATENNEQRALDYIFSNQDTPGFNDPPPEDKDTSKKKKKKPRLIPLELQRLFTQMQLLDCYSVSTHDLTTKGFLWQSGDGSIQHDAHELN